MSRTDIIFGRYLKVPEFRQELAKLRPYRGQYVGNNLLEELEEARLLRPLLRLHFPDPVARRAWQQNHPYVLKGPLEPDGPRWDAAMALAEALHRWESPRVYGPSRHPFDAPEERFRQFLEDPAAVPFQGWDDLRVDVSNDQYPTLFDNCNWEAYYSTWQLLLAAEIADIGVHFRVNLADHEVREAVDGFLRGGAPPSRHVRFAMMPVHAIRQFAEHRNSLDAVVWFAEECGRALNHILKDQGGGRFQLTPVQGAHYDAEQKRLAIEAGTRFGTCTDALVGTGKFLAERWADWKREERPLIAGAYKAFLAKLIQMLGCAEGLTFIELRDRVGEQGGWRQPILDVIWPDWIADEKERISRTLKASFPVAVWGPLDENHVQAFVDFLASEGLEAFFWRLRSFEEHLFRGNEFATAAMRSDLQGLGLAVEHMVRVLGGKHQQLYEMFKELWRDPNVLIKIKDNKVAALARQKELLKDWPALMTQFEALRAEGLAGAIAADLAMAYRIRGGAHHTVPAQGHFEIEGLFVSLLRAAFLTFREVRC